MIGKEIKSATTIGFHYHFGFFFFGSESFSRRALNVSICSFKSLMWISSLLLGVHYALLACEYIDDRRSFFSHSISNPPTQKACRERSFFQRNFQPANESYRSDIELITARRIDRSELAWSSTWFPISLRESISLNIAAQNVCTFNYRLFLYHHKNAIKAATESSEMERRKHPENEASLSPRSKITFFSSIRQRINFLSEEILAILIVARDRLSGVRSYGDKI